MERFRKYMDRDLNLESVKNSGRIGEYGVECTYLPDPPEEFDEFEFRTGFGGRNNIVVTVATEMGKIKRVMFGEADGDSPDVVRSLSESRRNEFLSARGEDLVGFFEYVTG